MKIINESGLEQVSLKELRPHPRNPRRGDIDVIARSIEVNGFYGAVVAQRSTGHILAGNHRYLAAQKEKAKEIPVIWLDVDDDEAHRIMLADNRTSDIGGYDEAALADLLRDVNASLSLDGTGYAEADLDALLGEATREGEQRENYTRKIETPIYHPRGKPPNISECFDASEAADLEDDICKAEIGEEMRSFLLHAAQRFTRFRYDKIADLYAHSGPEERTLFERLALVIIDFDFAIERGFVKMSKELMEIAARDMREGEYER